MLAKLNVPVMADVAEDDGYGFVGHLDDEELVILLVFRGHFDALVQKFLGVRMRCDAEHSHHMVFALLHRPVPKRSIGRTARLRKKVPQIRFFSHLHHLANGQSGIYNRYDGYDHRYAQRAQNPGGKP